MQWWSNDYDTNVQYSANQITLIEALYSGSVGPGARTMALNMGPPTSNTPATARSQTAINNVIGQANGGYLTGTIYEVIVLNKQLSQTQQYALEAYLAVKWGFSASLSPSNPFALASPAPFLYPTATPITCFTPKVLPNLALWFDSADLSTIVLSGSSVTAWKDKSGNGMHAVGGVALPTWLTTTQGIQFGGNNQFFKLPNGALPFGNSAFSIFVVAFFTTTATNQGVIGGGSWGTNNACLAIRTDTGALMLTYWWSAYCNMKVGTPPRSMLAALLRRTRRPRHVRPRSALGVRRLIPAVFARPLP